MHKTKTKMGFIQ